MEDEFKKMITGKIYYGASTELLALQSKADEIKAALDAIPLDQRVERHKAMTDLFGSVDGPCIVKPPFTVEFGCNIHLGAGVFINNGATFMYSALTCPPRLPRSYHLLIRINSSGRVSQVLKSTLCHQRRG